MHDLRRMEHPAACYFVEPDELRLRAELGLLPKRLPKNLHLLTGEYPDLAFPLPGHRLEELPRAHVRRLLRAHEVVLAHIVMLFEWLHR